MSLTIQQSSPLKRLTDAIAQRVGQQRFNVWFNNSTRIDLRQDILEIAVPNDFISEWINRNFATFIQEALNEVLGAPVPVRFAVVPQLFDLSKSNPASAGDKNHPSSVGYLKPDFHPIHASTDDGAAGSQTNQANRQSQSQENLSVEDVVAASKMMARSHNSAATSNGAAGHINRSTAVLNSKTTVRPRLRHDFSTFVVGGGNQLAYNAAMHVAEFPGTQYNPLFIHGQCGLGKTHLLQGICRKFIELHPARRWVYMTGEDFTNEFVGALRTNKVDVFRRKMRDLDLLVIDDVHFLGGKKASLEEFLHTFNAIEAAGKQVVMASDNHPKMIEEFGESLINRFVSGMVVRVDPPNFETRREILRALANRAGLVMQEPIVEWVARRMTQNIRELEGAVTRISAHVNLTGRPCDHALVQDVLGDLDRHLVAPVRPENIFTVTCTYFGLEMKDLMSGRRQRTISLARSVAMYLIRKTAKLSYPEIGTKMGKRNHSTVISACRRIEKAVDANEMLDWSSGVGDRQEEARDLLQRLEDQSRMQAH